MTVREVGEGFDDLNATVVQSEKRKKHWMQLNCPEIMRQL
jgi:hypothetical protein